MKLFLSIAILSSTSTMPAFASDPPVLCKSDAWGSSHYQTYRTDHFTWAQAKAFSESLPEVCGARGQLVSVNSAAEDDFVTGMLCSGTVGAWIGLTDAATEGQFEWLDGTSVASNGYGDNANEGWCGGEPNQYLGRNEDYGHIIKEWDGCWNDIFDSPGGAAWAGPNYEIDSFIVEYRCNPSSRQGAGGDPHFKTWFGEWYDFHGECDLVLLDAPDFNNGEGLRVHIRTTLRNEYSYIEQAAIQAGEDILEIAIWGNYFLNGIASAKMPKSLSNYTVNYPTSTEEEHKFVVDMGARGSITIRSFKDMLSVMLNNVPAADVATSKGLMGSYTTGHMVGRDGKSTFDLKHDKFGQEWQVTADEPMLFQTKRAPQYPFQCIMPDRIQMEKRRRLGESNARATAEQACAHWPFDQRELCVYDVMATGDLEYAQAGGF